MQQKQEGLAEAERKQGFMEEDRSGNMETRNRIIGVAAAGMLLFWLTGCGGKQTASGITEGMQHIQDMEYEEALACFQTAEEEGGDARLIARGIGIASMGLVDYETAIESFLTCLSLSDGRIQEMDYDVNFYLAAAYQKAGQYSEAEAVYDAILSLRPQDTEAVYLRGNARLSQGQFQRAKEDFDLLVELEPYHYARLLQVYEVLSADGYKEAGREYLEMALKERPERMTALDEGCIQYYLGNYEQAQVLLEEAKAAGGADACLYLGMAYEATGDYNYAITNVYTAYLAEGEGNAEIYNQLGLCYLKQENYAAALEAFQNAMQIPDNGMMQTLRFNEIVAYEYLGEYTKAAVLLDNYLKNYPDDEKAQREYGFLSTR